jgi:hypothetical protein
MNAIGFNKLDPEKQIDLVMTEGTILTQSKKYNLNLHLFQFNNFYVELFSKDDTGEIITTRAFEDTDHLDTYLQDIDISSLIPVC